MKSFEEYLDKLTANGECCFSIEQATLHLDKNYKTLLSAIERLRNKGKLASPSKGFYVIVPPQYRVLGCIPADQFLPQLMSFWQCSYYVGLLSAARIHGASHQALQVTQVMLDKTHRPINCGKIHIRFLVNRHLAETPTQEVTTPKSILTISTPEGTAMDLFRYSNQAGGLNHVITVLEELADSMKTNKLQKLLASTSSLPWKQRLGYCLEQLGEHKLADVVADHLGKQRRIVYLLLSPRSSRKTGQRDGKWKLIINTQLESDL